jgi:hypothetical protein
LISVLEIIEMHRQNFLLPALILMLSALGSMNAAFAEDEAKDARLFELRTYQPLPDKLDALLTRFRDHTCKLFEKHGMTNIGYWVDVDAKTGEKRLIYLLAHKDKQAADSSWKAFRADPVWIKAREASEKDGPILIKEGGVQSVYLTPTDFSKIR